MFLLIAVHYPVDCTALT